MNANLSSLCKRRALRPLVTITCFMQVVGCLTSLRAGVPGWWTSRNVFDAAQSTDDFQVINAGQLKSVAKKAMQEMDARLAGVGGAGSTITTMVSGFSATGSERDDYVAINVGQLKAIAKPYYDRLTALNYSLTTPWTNGVDDYAAVNIGQLKTVFSFPIPPTSAALRISNRNFPSVVQPWGEAENISPPEDELTTRARHDVFWHGVGAYGLAWNNSYGGKATGFTTASIAEATSATGVRQTLLSKNPNMVMLLEIRYNDGSFFIGDQWNWLPLGDAWWKPNQPGMPAANDPPGTGGYFELDFARSDLRENIVTQAKAAIQSGVVDGIMLDWWYDDSDTARQSLIAAIRAGFDSINRPDALIIVNSNSNRVENTKQYVNGIYMECEYSTTTTEWQKIEDTLTWAEANLRSPVINCIETWHTGSTSAGRTTADGLKRMRAVTTLSLTRSNGCCNFADSNTLSTADHLHNWYDFWNRSPASLGKPLSPGYQPSGKGTLWQREFANGWAVYNPVGNGSRSITFSQAVTSRATSNTATTHTIPEFDGDIFMKP